MIREISFDLAVAKRWGIFALLSFQRLHTEQAVERAHQAVLQALGSHVSRKDDI